MKGSTLVDMARRMAGRPLVGYLGEPSEHEEVKDMTERMTRKELTEKVKELERELEKENERHRNLNDRFMALIEFLSIDYEYVCGTDGYFKFRRKQSARANKKSIKENKT